MIYKCGKTFWAVFGTTSVSLVCSSTSEDRAAKTQKTVSKLQIKQFNSNQINAKAKSHGEAAIKLTGNNPVLPQKSFNNNMTAFLTIVRKHCRAKIQFKTSKHC